MAEVGDAAHSLLREPHAGVAAEVVSGPHAKHGLGLRHGDGAARQAVDVVAEVNHGLLAWCLEVSTDRMEGVTRVLEMRDELPVGAERVRHGRCLIQRLRAASSLNALPIGPASLRYLRVGWCRGLLRATGYQCLMKGLGLVGLEPIVEHTLPAGAKRTGLEGDRQGVRLWDGHL